MQTYGALNQMSIHDAVGLVPVNYACVCVHACMRVCMQCAGECDAELWSVDEHLSSCISGSSKPCVCVCVCVCMQVFR